MTSRERFEEFLVGEYEWAEGALNAAIFCGDVATGHYVCGYHIYDKQDCSECLFWAWRGWQAASKASEQQLAAVVAENVGLKAFGDTLHEIKSSLVGGGHGHMAKADMQAQGAVLDVVLDAFDDIKTLATDAYLAGIKADGRVEGINFAASRLAAAFNHGFVDKPMAEVFDVVRMILTAKEDLANDPAADGLSGEYAEKSLVEWEAVLREGAK